MDYELVVIGGGAGGMGAARAGARQGRRTLLVQDGPIGGDCTFTGCVPSKAVLAAAARGDDFATAFGHARRAIEEIAATEDAGVFRAEGIEVLEGRARFRSVDEIEVDGRRIEGRRFVIATGARPAVPPIDGLRQLDHLTSDTVWQLTDRPGTLAVLGGGPIGCELAQAFARLGSRVTLVEALDRLLSKDEPEASAAAHRALEADGVEVRLGQKVTRVQARGPGGAATVEVDGGAPVAADRVLVAIGRSPVTDGLDPDAAGVQLDDRGFVRTDDHLRTSAPSIYAVGDVAGKLQFTHAADEMARIAVGNAFSRFRVRRWRAEWTPWVTYLSPEIAHVGLTEAQAAERDAKARTAFLPMAEVDRAVAEGRTDGFVKATVGSRAVLGTVAGGRVLGATVVAPHAGEMIHEFALARRTGLFPAQLALTVHAYPTWSSAAQKVMAQFFTEVEGRSARASQAGDAPVP